jgi:hypothetical protein
MFKLLFGTLIIVRTQILQMVIIVTVLTIIISKLSSMFTRDITISDISSKQMNNSFLEYIMLSNFSYKVY